jgi:signal transduction histidine kinase
VIGSKLEWWYRPLIESKGWIALGSLFVGLVWSAVLFALAATVFFTTFALVLTVVGLVLVVPAASALNALASIERHRAGWIGVVIPPPQFAQSEPGWWSSVRTLLGDGARWRQVLFFGLFVVVGPVLFALGVLPWGLLVQLCFSSDSDELNFGGIALAVLLAGGAPRFTIAVAELGRAFTAALLGPSGTVELRERVTELSGQREQILDAVAGERRRIERNLHDGVQQQLVALGIDISRAQARLDTDPAGARELLDSARDKVRGSIGELRSIGRGLHPAVLEDRGLDAALSAVVANAPIPIHVQVSTTRRLPEDVAASAYYVANEAVANILKHAHARVASINVFDDPIVPDAVRLSIHDDGRGGADIGSERGVTGTGLAGMRVRVEGVDGRFDVNSPPGGPTTIVAVFPLVRSRE